ncbi:hypothetical protein B0H19DRAFT_1247680 [Mycena capillaripes]|nr:hypothetical protein B0H19DRAFT_1247680 [Mycena capillaripes]
MIPTALPAALAVEMAPAADTDQPARAVRKSWLSGHFSWETLPPLSFDASLDALPIALSGSAGLPQAMRG